MIVAPLLLHAAKRMLNFLPPRPIGTAAASIGLNFSPSESFHELLRVGQLFEAIELTLPGLINSQRQCVDRAHCQAAEHRSDGPESHRRRSPYLRREVTDQRSSSCAA